jgi:hypothetical protein
MKQLDFDQIAKRMRFHARSGAMCGDLSADERKYVRRCSVRAGTTTLVFTRDFGNHDGWLSDPTHDRCWHLSIACDDDNERDAWLRAFFGDHVAELWGQTCATDYGQQRGVWHWRLFCDQNWEPMPSTNPDDLLAAHMYRAIDLGVSISSRHLAA